MAIRVLIMRPDRSASFDVTDGVRGLQWSNINPGGHERATFTLLGSWAAGFREVKPGNIVRIEDGGAELFTGRIDDRDPQVNTQEAVAVTAYGLGVRLKDNTFTEIYVDRDFSRWKDPSVQRRLNLIGANRGVQGFAVTTDDTTGQPALITKIQGAWTTSSLPTVEPRYDSGGIPLGSIYYAWKKTATVSEADVNWRWTVRLATRDLLDVADGGINLVAAGPGTGTVDATLTDRECAALEMRYDTSAGGSANFEYAIAWTVLAVYGGHGLTKTGTDSATSARGFIASEIVRDIVSDTAVGGLITPRRIDASTFVVTQLAFLKATRHEDAVTEASKYDSVDWGTWGAEDMFGPFSDPTQGYFDWKAKDTTTPHWTAWRDECDEVDLRTELGAAYAGVIVGYTDASGSEQVETRTISGAPALLDAGLATTSRTAIIDGGTLTQAGAQQLGDAFLALSNGNAVSRGQVTIFQPIRHLTRGLIPPWHMRADGSNLLLPDAMPDRDMFGTASGADRRALFPIKRVSVDASGDKTVVTVEIDQTNNLMAILQARLALNAQTAIG
jgi:hypothetical protein